MNSPSGSAWWWAAAVAAPLVIYVGSYGALRWTGCIAHEGPMYAVMLSGACVRIDKIGPAPGMVILDTLYRPLIRIEEHCRSIHSGR